LKLWVWGLTIAKKEVPWYKKKLAGPFSKMPPDLELSQAQYLTRESAGEIKLGVSERAHLLALLRRYQLDRLWWTSAPRPREAREVLEGIQGDAEKLHDSMHFLLCGSEPAKEAALDELLFNAPAPEPTTPRWYGWDYPGNDWLTWIEDTLMRVTLLGSWSSWTAQQLRENSTGGRDRNEFLHGLIRSLRELFLRNHGRDEQRFGRDQRSAFICFAEAALRCIPDHPEIKALAKTISRALDEHTSAGQNPARKS
jgi:hypothetical protein